MHSTVEFNKKLKRWEMVAWTNLGDGIQISSAVVPLTATNRRRAVTEMHKVKLSLDQMSNLDSDALVVGAHLKGISHHVAL
ncbi:hypothetical protein UFOVP116_149 [uncultured Caudovirales phage]|uniref:Uncharacterized protein n=1 Tax=uncultured Caudovirales phage TaxID=2100421 RepID=A0A6J5LDZ3_9CAUD|nr:hypothetical protein UFOVP116_149 [uncultured Caudovirales phage]